jgi:hypothetical protein
MSDSNSPVSQSTAELVAEFSDAERTQHMENCTSPEVASRIKNHLSLDMSAKDHALICTGLLASGRLMDDKYVNAIEEQWSTGGIAVDTKTDAEINTKDDIEKKAQENTTEDLTSPVSERKNNNTEKITFENTPVNEGIHPAVLITAGVVGAAALVATTIGVTLHYKEKPSSFLSRLEALKLQKETLSDVEYRNKLVALYDEAFEVRSTDAWRAQAMILDEVDDLHSKNPSIELIEYKGPPAYLGGTRGVEYTLN